MKLILNNEVIKFKDLTVLVGDAETGKTKILTTLYEVISIIKGELLLENSIFVKDNNILLYDNDGFCIFQYINNTLRYTKIQNGGSVIEDNDSIFETIKEITGRKSPSISNMANIECNLMSYLWLLENSIFIMNEVELHLNIKNQRKLALVLVRLVNAGVKIIISTNSPYIVYEINNSIMMNSVHPDTKDKIMEKYKYDNSMILKKNQVAGYEIQNNTKVKKLKCKRKDGLWVDFFDDEILDLNSKCNDIYDDRID